MFNLKQERKQVKSALDFYKNSSAKSRVDLMYLIVPSNATPHVLGKVKRCIGK